MSANGVEIMYLENSKIKKVQFVYEGVRVIRGVRTKVKGEAVFFNEYNKCVMRRTGLTNQQLKILENQIRENLKDQVIIFAKG